MKIILLTISIISGYYLIGGLSGVVEAETSPVATVPPSSGIEYPDIDPCTLSFIECDIESMITDLANEHGVNAQVALDIAMCESSMDPTAQNKNSSAKGLYQFINKTWAHYCNGDVFDARDNAICFMQLYPVHPTWWECHNKNI